MSRVEIDKTNALLNKDWPIRVRVTESRIQIDHDAQRDAEHLSLTMAEWEWIARVVPLFVDAASKAADVVKQVEDA